MPDKTEPKQRMAELLSTQRGRQGLRRSDMRRALAMTSGSQAKAFREAFKEMMAAGTILRQRGGRYVLSTQTALVPGTFKATPRGFGFVTPEAGGQDIFIPPKDVHAALSGDRVLVEVTETADDRGPVGAVRRVTERTHSVMVASLVDTEAGPAVRPLRRELPPLIMLADDGHVVAPEDLVPGVWVEVSLNPQDGPRQPLSAVITRHIASPNPISGDLDAICAEYDVPGPYSADEQAAAAAVTCRELPREDARTQCVLTIDPVDAKDFDDGLSLLQGSRPGISVVGVHIADVASYVAVGGAVDLGARERGFTSYLPGRTLPMLPGALASRQCSLLEGEDRPAHTVYLEIDTESGRVVGSRRTRTLIRVRHRLSFAAVGRVLSGDDAVPAPCLEARELILQLSALAGKMRVQRQESEHFLRLAVPEVRVLCCEDPPSIQGLERVDPGPAHELVEEFMLAANVAVGREMADKEIPALYRNHSEPMLVDMTTFSDWVWQAVGARPPALVDRRAVNDFLASVYTSPLRDMIIGQFLRTMPRAVYGAVCSGHYGLGKEVYLHFTSPIRRYPDLLVHQQLQAVDLGERGRTADECEAIGSQCTALQESVDTAYYAAVDRLKLRYLRERQYHSAAAPDYYDGVVARCVPDGLLVYLSEVAMIGFVPVSRLSGSGYRLDRRTGRLAGNGSGKSYKSGDSMFVQIRRADTVRGELQLDPVRMRV